MSLSLIQGYSSAEEEPAAAATEEEEDYQDFSEEEEEEGHSGSRWKASYKAPANGSSSSSSILPSAIDAFSQVVSGPPQFLSNSVEEYGVGAESADHNQQQQGNEAIPCICLIKNVSDFTLLSVANSLISVYFGAVVEAKPVLVGISERVRSDVGAGELPPSVPSTTQEGGKRISTATNPAAEDAAELLRMCLQCGIPKTFSSASGMVCPVCGDRPPNDTSKESKKKGSAIKDKEKSKRMKGQSSHATWKSETEMQLRQQFD
ncbi:hypothetical protein POTOM_013130 [Populus tomentosa]|uniref:Uncharacterized protein n=1 Tax=Populus tomentosa TaxID=118781 RepID=A0A8X8CY73_POPTO|nr:hypothetical protein POTOM_013130 [Populus tomentosa]